MAAQAASEVAAFVLPYLRPRMRVLDVGGDPGSITLGLASAVPPGAVVGIDLQFAQVERARAEAAGRGGTNVRFEAGDVYEVPFSDGSFDAVFAHPVLMHLREPVRALTELRRVLRPGGIAGVRDPDRGAHLLAPTTPLLEQWHALRVRVRWHNGGDLFLGRHQRRLLLEAGFVWAEASVAVESAGSPESTRPRGPVHGLAPWLRADGGGGAMGGPADDGRNGGGARRLGRVPGLDFGGAVVRGGRLAERLRNRDSTGRPCESKNGV